MSGELPEGWCKTALEVLLREPLRNGHSAKGSLNGSGVRTLTLSAVTYGDFSEKNTKLTVADPTKVADLWLEPGDLLIERSNTPELVGTARLYNGSRHFAIFPDLMIRVRASAAVLPEFIESTLHSEELRRYFINSAQGTSGSMPKIDQGVILRVPVRLPPVAEQLRIVEKVETLLEQVNQARGRLAKVPLILKRFRQAVLAAACSGKLTEEWREAIPPDQLLTELLCEAGRFVEGQGYVRRRFDVGPGDEIAEGPDVPNGWALVPLRRLAVILSGQTAKGMDDHVGSRGKYPWFKVGDMNTEGNERFMTCGNAWLSQQIVEQLGLRPLPKGAVIFPKRGGAIATNKKRLLAMESCVDLNTMAFIPFEPMADYLWWWFASIDLGSLADGSNVPQINHPDIESLLVPVPPLAEQREIVRQVEELFALAGSIERRVATAVLRAAKIPQAILSKAFSGELVPTEAELARAEGREFEPASVLLERLQREQAHDVTKGTKGRAGRKTKDIRASK